MVNAPKSYIAALSVAFISSLSFLLLLLTKGPQVEPISAVDPLTNIAESLPVSLSLERARRFSFRFELRSDRVPEGLEILVGTFDDASVKISRAEAISENGLCRYKSEEDSLLLNNSHLIFGKVQCESLSQTLLVTIETDQPVRLAIWTYTPAKSDQTFSGMVLRDSGLTSSSEPRYIYGFYRVPTQDQDLRRVDLLNYMWNLGIDADCFLLLLIAAHFLTSFSICRFLGGRCKILSGAATWLFLCLTYALLIPPFQAPDEPDHILTYANIGQDTALEQALLALAQRGHFEHLKFFGHHEFTSTRMRAPATEGWANHISAVNMEERSPMAVLIWKVYRFWLDGLPAGQTLLLLRVFNAIFVTCGLAGALAYLRSQQHLRASILFLFLSMPALPFFSMHVSNYFTSVFLALLQSGFFAALLARQKFKVYHCFFAGIMISISLASSAITLGLLAIWGFLLPWIYFGAYKENARKRGLIQAWALLVVGLFGGYFLLYSRFETPTTIWSNNIPSWLISLWTENKTMAAFQIMAIWITSLALLGLSMPRFLCAWLKSFQEKTSGLSRGLARILLVFLCSLTLLTILHDFSTLPNIEDSQLHLPPMRYAAAALKAAVLSFSFSHVDYYFSKSFWFGFGWLEFFPAEIMIVLFRSPLSIGYLFFIWKLGGRTQRESFSGWKEFAFLTSIFVMVLGLSAAVSEISVNLHGRYLIGYYVLTAIPAAFGWKYALENTSWRKIFEKIRVEPYLLPVIWIVGCHVFCAWLILDRYF